VKEGEGQGKRVPSGLKEKNPVGELRGGGKKKGDPKSTGARYSQEGGEGEGLRKWQERKKGKVLWVTKKTSCLKVKRRQGTKQKKSCNRGRAGQQKKEQPTGHRERKEHSLSLRIHGRGRK